jgi:hypothetical protein
MMQHPFSIGKDVRSASDRLNYELFFIKRMLMNAILYKYRLHAP